MEEKVNRIKIIFVGIFKIIIEKYKCWRGNHYWGDWWTSMYTDFKFKHRNCRRKGCRGHQVVELENQQLRGRTKLIAAVDDAWE